MECNDVRDQFSSLFESELGPTKEKEVKEHLDSCRNCQNEWEEFKRMMGLLHAVEEEEAPEGFLSEIQKKREDRKGQEKRGWVWSFRSANIPIQAAAMVMVVLLALYLNKMAPFDMPQKREVEKPQALQSDIEKKETILTEEESRKVATLPPSLYRKGDISGAKPSPADEKVRDKSQSVQKMKEGDKKLPAPPMKEEMAVAEPVRPKEMAKAAPPFLEEKGREPGRAGRVMMSLVKKPVREITLKISDREKAIFEVQELAKKMGGEAVNEDGDIFIAILPASSYAEFEKGLAKIGSLPATPKSIVEQERKDDFRIAPRVKSKESEEEGKEPLRSMVPGEDTVSIRIRLIPE